MGMGSGSQAGACGKKNRGTLNSIRTGNNDDLAALRRRMVDTQIITRGVRDKRVLDAMLKVPRHLFTPDDLAGMAYSDMALPSAEDQTISQPYMVAVMTELLELKGDEKVLEIGTGSGYQTAILAELAARVYTIERLSPLAGMAKKILGELGYTNIDFTVGDGTRGWPDAAPFQAILVTAAAPKVPPPLFEQLAEGGNIVIPVGSKASQRLIKGKKHKGKLIPEEHTFCAFVPLLGEYGF